MSLVATAYLQAELTDECDEMELEDERERRALGAFAFLFTPDLTDVQCATCQAVIPLDTAVPSEKVCEFRCEACDAKKVIEAKVPVIVPEYATKQES